MNVKTEARNEISTQETMESKVQDQKPSSQQGAHWILIVALVGVLGLVAALVIESSNSSSSKDVTTPAVTMDPQFDQDSHREPSPGAAAPVVSENRAHREADLFPATIASSPENQSHREADLFPSTPVADPRLDSDHHRDPNGTD